MAEKLVKQDRPKVLSGATYEYETGCCDIFVTVNRMDDKEFREVFVSVGKSGICISALCEAIGRLLSVALRSGIPKEELIKQLEGITCSRATKNVKSCVDAVALALQENNA